MFGFFKRKKQQEQQQDELKDQQPTQPEEQSEAPSEEERASEERDESPAPFEEGPVDEERTGPEAAPAEPDVVDAPAPEERAMAGPAADETREQTEAVETLGQEEENAALREEALAPETASGPAEAEPPAPDPEPAPEPERAPLQEKPVAEKKGWFARIRSGLGKTRANLAEGVAGLFLGKKQIDDELIEDLETQLLMADVGIEATTEIIDRLTERVSRKELKEPQALYRALQDELAVMLDAVSKPLALPAKGAGPFVILVVGVNGVGKTTTIGKLAQRFQREGRSVMLAAGDTFRAAAVEQLKVWGERNDVPVIAQHTGADSASVVYDAVAAAKARKVDVLIADTAGRLHNKAHLMEELKKVHRVMGKLDDTAPHEVMLVLDAGTGQNALSQASTFNEAVPVTGITLTKLDGTAKGGIIFALAKQLGTPIRFIGVGEGLDDLRPFEARDFVDALFDQGEEGSDATS
ncbi:signal recognition particle-docking protein FtsY [Billgrantia kenyensis]|uniref:Signal recognition particle receptor FtsY n=1 Tax=Billgrantia kenyensis TaxID=321266 RepID=A0A7V9VZH1_9GAMM|nr:signal recognition particle-docking protein FtsY [Halomonas kenyensis]MBA2778172.1 signal recognition particle-docking protein FtsY [Halomonas kenyensis]MCG6661049.1 signal recognition particle-docking protein FtsY [Halomonas kenyensis]